MKTKIPKFDFLIKFSLAIPMLVTLANSKSMAASPHLSEGYFISNPNEIDRIRTHRDWVFDHLSPKGFEVYGPKGLGLELEQKQISKRALSKVTRTLLTAYPSPEEVEEKLKLFAHSFPDIAQLVSIGKSVQGRNLWVMKLTAPESGKLSKQENRPEFKFIANMHGDEIVGREIMLRLIEDLITNYKKDSAITQLLNLTRIYIMPSMNPDGAAAGTRWNAKGVDLNRDFPDFTTPDNHNTPEGRAPETQAVMAWQSLHHFKLSANFHGGAEVVNYPWDTQPDIFPKEKIIKAWSLEYAQLAPYIGNSTVFDKGITNGFAWYEVNGGMQDWSIYWHNDLQITIELSDTKWPDFQTIANYYSENRSALLQFMRRVLD